MTDWSVGLPDSAADGDFVELNGAVRTAGDHVSTVGQSTADPVITVTIAGQWPFRKQLLLYAAPIA